MTRRSVHQTRWSVHSGVRFRMLAPGFVAWTLEGLKMKIKTMLAAASFSLVSVAAPLWACPGKEAQTASVQDQKNVQLTGVVSQEGCPMEASEIQCTGYVLTADKGGGKYMIRKNDVADKMLTQVKAKAKVKVKGDVINHQGRATFSVSTFKVGGNA